MSNLIDSSLPEEDSNWPEQQPGSNPTNISTGFGSSPFDDYAVKDMDLTNEPFGSSNVPSSGPTPFVPTVEGDLLNMSSEEIKSTQQSVPHSAPQSAPRSPPPPPPVFSQPEPTIKTEPTSTIQPEVKPIVDIKPEEPKQPKSEAKEIKKQDDKKDSKSKSDEAPSSSSHYCSFLTRNPHIADLVYWRDLKKSGIVFVAGLLLLLSLACCSIISVISHGSLLLVGCTLAYRIYTNVMQAVQKTDEGHPFKEYMEMDIIPSEEKFIELVGKAYNPLKVTLIKLKSIFLIEDYVDSIKYSVFFWCLTYVGAWFNGITLVTLFYLGLFSVPKLYEMNKSQIDVHLASVCTQLEGLCSQVKTKLPFLASKKEKSQ